jgi:hypothetical protein
MFILDSLMISGLRWTLETVVTAAEAEMNDDSVLREQLLEAEMRRELGEIGEEEFRARERDLLTRIRAIRERRDGGAAPLALASGAPLGSEEGESLKVEASLAGDFHDAAQGRMFDQPPPTAPAQQVQRLPAGPVASSEPVRRSRTGRAAPAPRRPRLVGRATPPRRRS